MGGKSKNSVYISVQCTHDEKAILDAAVKAAGKNRNQFIREWMNSLQQPPTKRAA